MRRMLRYCLFATALLVGCSREPQGPPVVVVVPPGSPAPVAAAPAASVVPAGTAVPADPDGRLAALVAGVAGPGPQERYDAALFEALGRLADGKYADALAALESARAARDTEQVRREIDRVRGLIEQQAAAERTARDVTAVLNDGKPAEAAALATAALGQFGGTDAAATLERVQRQADALAAAAVADAAARRDRFLAEAEAARRDNNLRAAAVALEQIADNAEARRRLDEVSAVLSRYDAARRRAAELRRDPTRLEAALAALAEARQAWDTPQVRSEIDDCNFALQNRRDRLGVADFEVRGDLGVPGAGRAVAEQLLPGFRPRFDVVERGQIGRVFDELRLEAGTQGLDPSGLQEVARLAGLRYLVVGSLTPLNGVTAQARLVEVGTGLVVQTACVSAPTVDALVPRLPLLAQVLMMTDEQKFAFEQARAAEAAAVTPILVSAPLPPPPPPYVPTDPPPPPVVTYSPAPPPFGGLVVQDFASLPPVGVAVATPAAAVVVEDDPRRHRLLALSLELGDNLFRRGKHQEARRHFELALSLSSNRADVQLRIDRCRPTPPPPPAVVVQPAVVVTPQPVVVVAPPPRPRIVVFSFVVNAQPGLVPPAVSDWAADQFASYWSTGYDVVERGELCWYMGRLGLTVRDVLVDPGARRCLAQALNVRYLAFGAIEQTNSFNVSTHLIDAETGARTGTGTIHVQDHNELKLRMHELAKQTGAAPAEQARLAQAGRDNEAALNEARRLQKSGDFARAAQVAREALKNAPNNVALQAVLTDSEQQAKRAEIEAARKQEAARRAAEAEAARKHAEQLARDAEAARVRAAEEARRKDAAARQAQEQEKQRAYGQLRERGRAALSGGKYAEAVAALESAAALRPCDESRRDLADAKARAAEAERIHAAEEKRQHDLAEQRQREEALARARAEQERQRAEEAARLQARRDHDAAEAARAADQARRALARQDYATALAAAQSAARLHDDAENRALVEQARHEQELAARAKAAQVRAEAERAQAAERAAHDKAVAEAEQRRAAQARAEQQAREQMSAQARAEQQARDQRAAQEQAAARRRKADYDQAMDAGRSALRARNYPGAVNAFGDALRAVPNDPAAAAALRDSRAAMETSRPTPPPPSAAPPPPPAARPPAPAPANARAEYDKWMQAGAAWDRQGKHAEAAATYREALKHAPGDARATEALRVAEFNVHLGEAQRLHAAKKFTEAAREYEEALKRSPNDAGVKSLLQKARQGKAP